MVHRDGHRSVTGGLDGALHEPVERAGGVRTFSSGTTLPSRTWSTGLTASAEPRIAAAAPIRPPRRRCSRVSTTNRVRVAAAISRAVRATAAASAPAAADRAAASTAKPAPIAADRESTTVTMCSPTWEAASRAASQVPDSSEERWMETS